MIQTPAHKQTDPNKKHGQVVYPIKKKLTFEEWWEKNNVVLKYINGGKTAAKAGWDAAQENK